MGQGRKTLKRNVVPTFEDLKKPVVESKRKPPAARKSLFEEIGGAFAGTNEQKKLKTYQRLFELIVITFEKKKQSSKFPLTNWKK